MKKYKVNVKRTEYGFVEVEAEDKQEATDIATENGDFNWMNEDPLEIMDVEEIKIAK